MTTADAEADEPGAGWQVVVVAGAASAWAYAEAIEPFVEAVALDEVGEGALWRVTGIGPRRPAEAALRAALAGTAARLGEVCPAFVLSRLPPRDWLAENRASFPPLAVGRFFVWRFGRPARLPPGKIAFRVDASLAFGSGEHATTAGCLRAIDGLRRRWPAARRLRVLDMGTGTGILALAAAGAWRRARVLAVDIDPAAVGTAAGNVRGNGLGRRIRVARGASYGRPPLARAGTYDLVLANILAGPLVALAEGLKRALAPGGVAVLSGLLAEQERPVLGKHRAVGLVLAGRRTIAGWTTLVLRRPGRARLSAGRSGAAR